MRRFISKHLRVESAFFRRALTLGVEYGPTPLLRYAPPLFGLAFGAGLAGARESVRDTLRRVRGKRSVWREAYEVGSVFVNFASSMTDAMVAAGRPEFEVKVDADDAVDALRSCAERGRGVILAAGSTAGWDIAGPALCHNSDAKMIVVMANESVPVAMRMHDEFRERGGPRILRLGSDPLAALPLIRHLRKGGLVATKFDRHVSSSRCREVTFLGQPWLVPEGALRLSALTGAPILPLLTRRLGFLEYDLVHAEPIIMPRRPSDADLDAAAQKLASFLDAFVRKHPTQWFRFQ
jgi:KDO2-lipid IV(A) lauroyltransferase